MMRAFEIPVDRAGRSTRRPPSPPAVWSWTVATPWTWLALAGAAALLALAPSNALLLLLAGAGGLLILRWPALGLALGALGVPFGRTLLPGPPGLPSLALLALAASASAWSMAEVLRGRLPLPPRLRSLPSSLQLGLGLFLASQLLALWWAPDLGAAFLEVARWIAMALALVLAAELAGRPGWQRGLVIALLVAGCGQALLGGWMAVQRIGPEAFAALGGRIYRAHGSFGQPNPFAGYMNWVWPLAVGILLSRLDETRRPGRRSPAGLGVGLVGLASLTLAACGSALVLSWSRGGWLAAAAGAVAMGLLWLLGGLRTAERRGRTAWLAWAGALALVLALWAGALERLPGGIVARLASIGQAEQVWGVADAEVTDANFSTIERIAHWEAAQRMFAQRPWTGQGPGHYELRYDAFRLPRWSEALGHAHNVYLNFLAESGLPGLAAFLLLWAALLWVAVRASLWPASPLQAALGLGLAGSLVATGVHNLLDNLFVHEMTVHLGLLAGLTLAAGFDERER